MNLLLTLEERARNELAHANVLLATMTHPSTRDAIKAAVREIRHAASRIQAAPTSAVRGAVHRSVVELVHAHVILEEVDALLAEKGRSAEFIADVTVRAS